MTKHTKEVKSNVLKLYQKGTPIQLIIQNTNIPRSTIYHWIKNPPLSEKEKTAKTIRILEDKIKRLEGIIEILKKVNCTVSAPLQERLHELEALQGQYNVHMLCEALDVSRGTFYNHIFRNKRDNVWYLKRREELREKIQQVFDESKQIYGAGKITAVLKERGYITSEKMVRYLMQEMGLISIRQVSKSLYEKELRRCNNRLNQQFNPSGPNKVWVSDVTYFRFNNKNFYICAVMDLFARTIIAYKISFKNSTQLVKSTFRKAYETRHPAQNLIFHTDRGTNYRSYTFCSYLKSLNVIQSFSRTHTPYDNSVMESFFSSMKREELYRTKYRSEYEVKKAIDDYIIFYNTQRPHANNQYKTPMAKEKEYYSET